MNKNRFITGSLVLLTGAMLALPTQPARAQRRAVQPERRLLNISLGASFMDVIRRYGQPSEIQTVALSTEGDQLPGLSGGGGSASAAGGGMYPGMMGGGGAGMMPGGQMGGAGMRGGAGMMPGGQMSGGMGMRGGAGMPGYQMGGGGGGMMPGGQMSGPGMRGGSGIPSLPPVGGGGGMMPGSQMSGGMMPGGQMGGGMGMRGGAGMMPGGQMGGGMGMRGGGGKDGGGMGGFPGIGGMGGAMGGGMGGGATAENMPEYSTATLWVYKRPSDIRLEFLINEDGRVAQISAAAPAVSAAKAAAVPGARTARGITLGTAFSRVTSSYGYPERFRMLPGLRFYETYFTKNYHAAFTFDTLKSMKCVRITIALAD